MFPSPEEWPAAKVRQTFIDYFTNKPGCEHTFWPSSNVVPHDDPSLLFVNAGMVPYKSLFLGTADAGTTFGKLKRAVNSQKCIRAGGKHNDLDDVGKDNYHHTFFEMLGNWSFGDYFKEEAIAMAWDLLTRVYGLPKERLYVTYFEGDEGQGLEPDMEAKRIWLSVGVPEDHILPGNLRDNFWEMGAVGPCGPCSEVHFDRVGNRNAAHLVNQDDPNVLEIWNIVFIAFNREQDLSLKALPAKHIDMGLGFERLVSCLQDKSSNYDTDLFTPLLERIREMTVARPYSGKMGEDDVDGMDTAYRVLADHVRTLTFAISDGCLPSNVGRGYVLRRILRRGARYASSKFGVKIGTFFSTLSPTVVEHYGEFFPELKDRIEVCKNVLDSEEASFARSLDRGEVLFAKYAAHALEQGHATLDGADVWRLYDTFGFPVDLTRLMAEERGLAMDEESFERAKQKSLEVSKSSGKVLDGDVVQLDVHDLGMLEGMEDVPKTKDDAKYVEAILSSTIKAIYQNNKFVHNSSLLEHGTAFGLLLDHTNFYAEAGGQQHDTGLITIEGTAHFAVIDVRVYNGYVIHVGHLKAGQLRVGDEATCMVDQDRRCRLQMNHTATHLLNLALRETLGDNVDQRGSLVAPEKLRLDYTCASRPSDAQIQRMEEIVLASIRREEKVYTGQIELHDALKVPGIRAVFGERYLDIVRCVSIGASVEEIMLDIDNPKWRSISIELCSGTHVANTGEISEFVIVDEGSIAKGVRRIVALTDQQARDALRVADVFSARLDNLTGFNGREKDAAIKSLLAEILEREVPLARMNVFMARVKSMQADCRAEIKITEAVKVKKVHESIARYFTENPAEMLYVGIFDSQGDRSDLNAAVDYGKKNGKAIYVFGVDDASGKVLHQNFVPSDMVRSHGLKASAWLTEISMVVGGKGGGNDNVATASGDSVGNVKEAVNRARDFFAATVGQDHIREVVVGLKKL